MPYPLKNGKWKATRMINGKRKEKTCATKREALTWEAAQTEETWEARQTCITCLEWCNAYLTYAQERFSKKTYEEKRFAFRNLISFVGKDTPVEEIPMKKILDALRNRAKSRSGNAANKDRKNLAAAWHWGRKYLAFNEKNPFLEVDRFAHDEKGRYVPTPADFEKAMAAAGPEDRVFLLTALHTGARRGELFRLTWPDIDLANGTIRLGTRKTATGGMEYAAIPMTPELRQALADHRRRGPRSMTVFTTVEGEDFTSRQHYMARLCKRAGVKPFGFHAIRHLSAVMMYHAGQPVSVIQAMLRHKNAGTTERYLKRLGLDPEKLRKAVEAVFSKPQVDHLSEVKR
jgi:integrase